MSLRRAVAAPFRQEGVEQMPESEFVVALSLDRDWFSPDQAKRLITVADGEGLLDREAASLALAFDPHSIEIPDGFEPDESILQARSTFERALDTIVDAGVEKQTAVANINRIQSDLGVTIEAAAVVYAHREGVAVDDLADRVREHLGGEESG
ncbi:DUF2240 family protein [Halovenus marina]|uniref:DUF2240 family protein n=1 Tax=Halovenus marina TaxID=3396621 RepID=UPI003F55CFB7